MNTTYLRIRQERSFDRGVGVINIGYYTESLFHQQILFSLINNDLKVTA